MPMQQEKPSKTLRSFNALGPCANVFVSYNTGSWRLERPQVDFEACKQCGICQRYCPAGVISIHKDEDECVRFLWNYCKGCGICANECPVGCITMVEEKGDE